MHNSLDGSEGHCSACKKLVSKGLIQYDSIYYNIHKMKKIMKIENRSLVFKDFGVLGAVIKRQHSEDLCHDEIFLYLVCGGGYTVLQIS